MISDDEMSVSEVLRRYAQGQRRFQNVIIQDDGSDALSGATLDEIEIIACVVATSFHRTSLRNAVIHANVKTCDFSGADLAGADFRDSALCATNFTGANMESADFTGAYFHSHQLKKGENPDW